MAKGKRYSQKRSAEGTNLYGPRGWQMSTYQLKAAMGLGPKKDWPLEGMPWTPVGDTMVIVRPANVGNDRRHKSSTHRAYAMCNNCLESIPAGRLGQHRWVCENVSQQAD